MSREALHLVAIGSVGGGLRVVGSGLRGIGREACTRPPRLLPTHAQAARRLAAAWSSPSPNPHPHLTLTLTPTRPLAFSLLLGLGSLYIDVGLNYQNLLSFLPYFIGE